MKEFREFLLLLVIDIGQSLFQIVDFSHLGATLELIRVHLLNEGIPFVRCLATFELQFATLLS